jgi:hypothetical protein
MIEASPSLRETQRRLLCGDAPWEEAKEGLRSTSKTLGVPMIWAEDIRFIPKGESQTEAKYRPALTAPKILKNLPSLLPTSSSMLSPFTPSNQSALS